MEAGDDGAVVVVRDAEVEIEAEILLMPEVEEVAQVG